MPIVNTERFKIYREDTGKHKDSTVAFMCNGCGDYFTIFYHFKITILTTFDLCSGCFKDLENSIADYRAKTKGRYDA